MPDPRSRSAPPKSAAPGEKKRGEGMPTNAELLYELRKHGAKPPPPRPLPAVSRRTRDFLLVAAVAAAVIGFAAFRIVGGSDPSAALKLALTGIGVFVALLWFIFYGVISRY